MNADLDSSIELVNVYEAPIVRGEVLSFLYDMLRSRPAEANISHREMPSFEDHRAFFSSAPYEAWYLVLREGLPIGNIYLTRRNEIGIQLISSHLGKGIGPLAISKLMDAHGHRRYLANVAVGNRNSISMFAAMGFYRISITYELDTCSKRA